MRMMVSIAVACALSAPAGAQSSGERLMQADLPGFVVGYSADRGPMFIEERIPAGETVQKWTRMITKQRFAGASGRLLPADLLSRMATGLTTGCPGGRSSAIRQLVVGGASAAEFRADCPRNPSTGQPETFFARAFAGPGDLHVLQVAFRKVPTPAEAFWAEAHLDTAFLCSGASPDTRCKRR